MSDVPSPCGEMRVDGHAHVFLTSLPLSTERRYEPAHDAPLVAYLGHLDQHRLTHGVLVQPSFLGTDNRFLLEALKLGAGRLRGVSVVDPDLSPGELDAQARAGVVGVRLNLIGRGIPQLEGRRWYRLWEFVAAHRWHVEVHADSEALPAILRPLLAQGLRIAVDHFGRVGPQRGTADPGFRYLLSAADSGQLWVKLSAGYRLDGPNSALPVDAAAELLAAFGPRRLVWGSDWPHTMFENEVAYENALQLLERCIPNADDRQTMLGASAAELFHFNHEKA